MLWPPPRTASGRLLLRAKPTAAITSAAPAARTTSAGLASNAPFQTRRASSYSGSAGVTASPRRASRNSCRVASPRARALIAVISASFRRLPCARTYRAALCAPLAVALQLRQPLVDGGDTKDVVAQGVAAAGVCEERRRLLEVAAEECDLGEARQRVGDPTLALCLSDHRVRLVQRCLGVVEAAACQGEIGRPPERAREPPPVAGPPEHVTCLGQGSLGSVIVACRRLDQAESREHESTATAVPQPRPQFQRCFELLAGGGQVAFDQPEVGPADEDGGQARLVLVGLEPCGALVEQRVRLREVAAGTCDACLVRERVADRRFARDLDER